jgi:hypothetical protein
VPGDLIGGLVVPGGLRAGLWADDFATGKSLEETALVPGGFTGGRFGADEADECLMGGGAFEDRPRLLDLDRDGVRAIGVFFSIVIYHCKKIAS